MSAEKVRDIISCANIIILDIEGTTTSISFVKEELFPFAENHLENYVKTHWNEELKEILPILLEEQETLKDKGGFIPLSAIPSDESELNMYKAKIISHLRWQQSNDFKTTGLKRLQGYIWKNGYLNKLIKGHIYEDVPEALKQWKKLRKKIFIYSSGSIGAQKLLFSYSSMGNLDEFIDGNFDTTTGSKTEPESYLKICKQLNEEPERIVFFTDRPKEVVAAKKTGMKVVRMVRDDSNPYLEQEKEFLGAEDATLTSFL